MENNLNIIVHVKDTKEVIFKTVLDAVNVDDDDTVVNEVIEYMAAAYGAKYILLIEYMAAVYGAKYILLFDNPQYQKYQDYNSMFFVNKDNYFEVTFDIDHPNDCHVFIGNF